MLKIACLSLSVLFLTSGAQGQASSGTAGEIRFETPFAFHVGERILPAGAYGARWNSGGYTIVTANNDDGKRGFVLAKAGGLTLNGKTPTAPTMVFNKYGDSYFLSQMWHGDRSDGITMLKSRAEHEQVSANIRMARNGVERVIILATRLR